MTTRRLHQFTDSHHKHMFTLTVGLCIPPPPLLRLLWLRQVTTTSQSLSLSLFLSTAKRKKIKTPPGMLRGQIGEIKWRLGQSVFVVSLCLTTACCLTGRPPPPPPPPSTPVIRFLLASFLSVLFSSPSVFAFSTSLRSDVVTTSSQAAEVQQKLTAPKKQENIERHREWRNIKHYSELSSFLKSHR